MPKKTETPPDVLTLDYNLFDLPTAQHKAGLVGLLILIDVLKQRGVSPLPEVTKLTETSASIQITQESLQSIFDELFDAEWVERDSKSKWAGAKPKEIREIEVEVEGKTKTEKRFVYEVFEPKGKFLQDIYPPQSDAWLKLWRDMLWNTLRGQPATRNVYKERADGHPSSEASVVWKNLLDSHSNAAKGKIQTDGIAGSLLVGAQGENAEKIPFQGRIEENFLLNFWSLPSLIYAPRKFDIKGKIESAGYVIVIPEPNRLIRFQEHVRELLRILNTKVSGFYPEDAAIDLPQEAGLEYIFQYTKEKANQKDYLDDVTSVEMYHLEKQGNSIKLQLADHVMPDTHLLEEYTAIRNGCKNPYFKSQRILNLLKNQQWYVGFDSLLSHYPNEIFVYQHETNKFRFPFFGDDARRQFSGIKSEIQNYIEGGISMEESLKNDLLAIKTYDLITEYVRRRAEEKSGWEYEKNKNQKDEKGNVIYPKEYKDALLKICNNEFLAIRSRRERNDFVEFFTGTICSVPQWLQRSNKEDSKSNDDYLLICKALMSENEWESVRTFLMLALSANSAYGRTFENKNEGEKS